MDSGDIPINRINILLGNNSSGKSSFVRLFLMLKQTINHHRRGAILWFDEYYDFGKFETALSRHAEGGTFGAVLNVYDANCKFVDLSASRCMK